MRIVVIGGTRFMGPHVVRLLAGHDVTLFHRGTNCKDTTHLHGDRMHLPRDLHGDVVVDMCCMTEAHAQTAAKYFRDERLVVISSADVYRNYDGLRGRYNGPPDPVPLREDAPLREKLYPYGDDYEKILVERTLAAPRTTILRLPAVYGPNDEQHRFAAWLKPDAKIDVKQSGWRWTRGYVENVADAIVLATLNDQAAGRVYNVGEPDSPTEIEWASMVAARHPEVCGPASAGRLDFEYALVTDSSAIRRDLGYVERVSRKDALARTIAWERTLQ
jgi:nucleoside-diphosphate-sugar epimerase